MLMSPNSDAFVIAVYAVLRTGAILVPANPRNAPPGPGPGRAWLYQRAQ
jgi:fatty-acyl-CoA synthase